MSKRRKLSKDEKKTVMAISVSREFRTQMQINAERMNVSVSKCVETMISQTPVEFAKVARQSLKPLILGWVLMKFYQLQTNKGRDFPIAVAVETDIETGNVGLIIRHGESGEELDAVWFDFLLNCDDKLVSFLRDSLTGYGDIVDQELND